jgi:SAM-dependent methyltransferase
VGLAVAMGNIVSFSAEEGPVLLREIGRVLRPGGLLVADFMTPVGALQEFLRNGAEGRFLVRILRRHRFYMIDRVLTTHFQPYAPQRLGRWEFRFYTAEEASKALARAGFRVKEVMSIAPVARMDNRVISAARRDPRAWRSLIQVEEQVGHRSGVLETGDGFLVAAVRSTE